jgi:hypothetical protein
LKHIPSLQPTRTQVYSPLSSTKSILLPKSANRGAQGDVEPEAVVSSIGYLKPLDLYEIEKPYYSNIPLPNGRQSNIFSSCYPNITLTNIRPKLSEFTLDKQGFEVVQYDGDAYSSEDFSSDSWIERNYYPVVEKVLLRRFGNVTVKIFDHTVGYWNV